MDAAKTFIAEHTSRRGHKTDVDEFVKPAVTWETVKPELHEEVVTAVDREVHQDHYHTTIQPIEHKEILPAVHKHNLIPVKDVEFRHGNEEETRQRLAAEAAHFKNIQTVEETRRTQAALPTVTGEHIHHHVHETVQPVIYKETVAKEYVHTVVPVHEVHRAAAEHHGMSRLPVRHLESFIGSGGVLDGGARHAHEEYEGAPRPYNEDLSTDLRQLGLGTSNSVGTGNTVSSSRHTPIGTNIDNSAQREAVNAPMTNTHHTKHHRDSSLSDSGVSGVGSNPSSPTTGRHDPATKHRNDRIMNDDTVSRTSSEYSTSGRRTGGLLSKITGRSHRE